MGGEGDGQNGAGNHGKDGVEVAEDGTNGQNKGKKTESAEVMCCPSAVQLLLTSNNAVPLIPLTRLTQH